MLVVAVVLMMVAEVLQMVEMVEEAVIRVQETETPELLISAGAVPVVVILLATVVMAVQVL
jgi:hypothetical protein